ncbi:MAG: hypothetical protein E7460_10565 [Ruminococcaceae bacterium]|nr:hypothetical protein [Oscillospiraceae bacterium]
MRNEFLPLYGDGVRDDTAAIQQRIDSGLCELILPAPENFYLISSTLVLPSNFRLVLPRFARIRLADGSNCFMLRNRRPNEEKTGFWNVSEPCPPEDYCHNIEICGGVWDLNNLGQQPNPMWTPVSEPRGYTGFGMVFYAIKGFKLSNLTLKDPVNFAATLDRVENFTVENIDFDFNHGNPVPVNMDGIHLNGNCRFGVIRNLKGACYDDTVALNADEGSDGPITDVEVSGIWAEDCHSAVRLLTGRNIVENVHIHDIYGTYFQYCVGFTNQFGRPVTGHFANISINNIYASKAERHSIYQKDGMGVFALFFFEKGCRVADVSISDFHRKEKINPYAAIDVEPEAIIRELNLSRIYTENLTGEEMPLLKVSGTVENLNASVITTGSDPVVSGTGRILGSSFA